MSKALGERKVLEQDDVTGLIVRMARPVFRWDVWTIVDAPERDEGERKPIYGRGDFKAVRAMARFYIDDVSYYARKVGVAITEAGAERRSRRAAERFIRWREKQRAIEQSMEAVADAR